MMERKGKSNNPILVSALLALAGSACVPRMVPLGEAKLLFTNSIFSVFLFGMLWFLIHKAFITLLPGAWREWRIAGLLSLAFTVCMAFGAGLEEREYVIFTDIKMWIAILVLTIINTLLLQMAWEKIDSRKLPEKIPGHTVRKVMLAWENLPDLKQWLLMVLMLLLSWLPVFLAVYPGFFVYDAQDEYMQVVTREFSSHHPLVHVLLLGGIIQIVYKLTDSYNLGIACYTIFQMLILSGIFSYGIIRMRKRETSFFARAVSLLYLGFFPVIVMFTLCSAKDGLFTGMLLLVFLMSRELCVDPENFWSRKGNLLLFVLASMGTIMLRHNGKYAYWVFAVILVLFVKQNRGKLLSMVVTAILLAGMISSALSFILYAQEGGRQEMLTVPIQQMARVWNDDRDNMSEEDQKILYEILPEGILYRYTPKVSDSVKIHFNNEAFSAEPLKYMKLWLKLGIIHPFSYVNAWFMTSYGFWYPDTVIDVYRGNSVFTYTYEDSSYFGYEVEEPGIRESRIPWLDEFYRKLSLEITQQKIPVVSMLFSPGFMFWLFVFTMGYLWKRKRYSDLIPFLLPLLVWLTVILGPTYLVRYVVFLWVLAPWMLTALDSRSAAV